MTSDELRDLYEREGFQKIILHYLVDNNHFVEGLNSNYNIEYALDEKLLFEYLEKSQKQQFDKMAKKANYRTDFMKYLREEIHRRGLLDVLRNPVKYYGAHFDMVAYKPTNALGKDSWDQYNQNIISVTEELVYRKKEDGDDAGRGDLCIFVNGIPIFWFELKCNSSGQNVNNAIKQYRVSRNPSEQIFKFKEGCLVCFAMDLDDTYFTTKLDGEKTYFMPYNKGVNKRKGNPDVPNKVKTSYMWEEILTKDNILEWLGEYIVLEVKDEIGFNGKKEHKETIIFPRYHQFSEVTRIIEDVKAKGQSGQNYLVMDSPGSGKTYSIAWLTHHLAELCDNNEKKLFDTVFIITDRLVVDNQLQEAVVRIPHTKGEISVMDDECTSEELYKAINRGDKIIVSSIQKFSYILAKVSPNADKHYAVVIDECHSSTKGSYIDKTTKALSAEEARKEDEALDDYDGEDEINEIIENDIKASSKKNNITFFGFSATPKKKTLEKFGTKTTDEEGNVVSSPFTCYSMQQAIDEGFILDVLTNYTTYETYFNVNKKIRDNPEFNKVKAQRAIYRYAMLHPTNIKQKIEIIMEHFIEHVMFLLDGNAKAMVVTDSREAAVKYKREFDKYIREHNIANIKALVAFTGKLKVKDYGEEEFSESKMNGFPEDKTADAFNTSEYRILLVANKYQTGYDQKLLCAMYVDKKFRGINAVQTLGRLNRAYPGKEGNVFILDFRNTYDDIKEAFRPYYEDLNLIGETDPNKIYALEEKINSYALTTDFEIDKFCKLTFLSKRTEAQKSEWYSYLSKAKSVYNKIADDHEKDILRKTIKKFVEGYAWILQTTEFVDDDLHKKYQFYRELSKYLRDEVEGMPIDPSALVSINKFKQKKTSENKTKKTEIEAITITKVGSTNITVSSDELFERIDVLIKELNERFNGELEENTTSGIIFGIIKLLAEDNEVRRRAQQNSPNDFKLFLKEKIDDVLFAGRKTTEKFYGKMLHDEDATTLLSEFLNNIVYNEAREKIKEYTELNAASENGDKE